jgi:hypothetical protein
MTTRAVRELKADDVVLFGNREAKVIETQIRHYWDDGLIVPSASRIFITLEDLNTQHRPPRRAILECALYDLIEVPSDT